MGINMSKKYKLVSPSGDAMLETDDKKTMYAFMYFMMKSNDHETFVDMILSVDNSFRPKTTFMWECAKEDFMLEND